MGSNPEFAGLTIKGHDSGAQSAKTETAMDADQGSAAPKNPGDQRVAQGSGHYGLLDAFSDSAYMCDLAPLFQKMAPTFGENDSQSLPKPAKMTGPQAEWRSAGQQGVTELAVWSCKACTELLSHLADKTMIERSCKHATAMMRIDAGLPERTRRKEAHSCSAASTAPHAPASCAACSQKCCKSSLRPTSRRWLRGRSASSQSLGLSELQSQSAHAAYDVILKAARRGRGRRRLHRMACRGIFAARQ